MWREGYHQGVVRRDIASPNPVAATSSHLPSWENDRIFCWLYWQLHGTHVHPLPMGPPPPYTLLHSPPPPPSLSPPFPPPFPPPLPPRSLQPTTTPSSHPDARSASQVSLVPASSDGTKRTLLLIYIHGFMGNETSFQAFPVHLHNLLCVIVAPLGYLVHTKVYPKFKTRHHILAAAETFSRWFALSLCVWGGFPADRAVGCRRSSVTPWMSCCWATRWVVSCPPRLRSSAITPAGLATVSSGSSPSTRRSSECTPA